MNEQTDTPSNTTATKPMDAEYASGLVRSLAIIFSNFIVYGPRHTVTRNSLSECYDTIQLRLAEVEEINFNVIEDKFLIDGIEIDMKGAVLQKFQGQFARMGVSGFAIQRGMDLDEFTILFEIISSKPDQVRADGGFAQLIASRGMSHTRARVVTYQAVEDHQSVVSRNEEGGQGTADTAAAESAVAEYLAARDGDAAAVSRQISEIACDVKKLAHVIFHAARQQAGARSGPEFTTAVVVCLKRTYDALARDAGARTPTGKKALVKTLSSLRDELQAESGRETGKDEPLNGRIDETIEEMADELQIDALAAEYLKKRAGIAKSEKRLMKFMCKVDPGSPEAAVLQQKLLESGIPPEQWDELVSRGRELLASKPDMMPVLESVDAGVFENLLGRLKERLGALDRIGKGVPVQDLQDIMDGLDRELASLVARVDRKIKALSMTEEEKDEEARAAFDEAARKSAAARRRRMELIAQIAQEFCQPLAVIDCSVDMIRKCRAGVITEQQGVLLSLASQSSERLNGLITDLIEICGIPESMMPREKPVETLPSEAAVPE